MNFLFMPVLAIAAILCDPRTMTYFASSGEFGNGDLEVAAILAPEPDVSEENADVASDLYAAWMERLKDHASQICLARENGDDPLVNELASLRRQRTEIEQQMILLVAYMREKVKPRPYTLQQTADAAGMSISGTRTFYDASDVELLDKRIAAAKRAVRGGQDSASTATE